MPSLNGSAAPSTGPHHAIATETSAARERLLLAASDLFCRQGINATGVDAIVAAAGTAKTTLYKAFGSKEGLIEAVLEHEGRAWRDWFIGQVDALPGDASAKLVHLFDVLKKWFAEEHFYGCPFINAVGECDKDDDRMRTIALKHKGLVMEKIRELARAARPDDPEGLAHEMALLIDGAIVSALITRDPNVADHARNAAQRVLTRG
ncbi:TetR family transcriptional regulator [Breoghania corrubedonensis]|uniref:TetR family transcriptional regulator n=1 Tax=Breoghania corrubedonensis TaxID=665038 RepID=A0A2T5V7T8_9HYPH|nr:TetR/AcrR family transcriptional regulator [Breoghania corrubedonensis]PTW59811.1 TetR family transcriptional regulator [Breoghania corrubedonensis]